MGTRKPDWRKLNLVYSAIERDSVSGNPELAAKADDAMLKVVSRTLDGDTFWHYVARQQEWRAITNKLELAKYRAAASS